MSTESRQFEQKLKAVWGQLVGQQSKLTTGGFCCRVFTAPCGCAIADSIDCIQTMDKMVQIRKGQFWGKGSPIVKYMDFLPWAVQKGLISVDMPFGMLDWVDPSNRVLDEDIDLVWEWAILRGKYMPQHVRWHCDVNCAKMAELIKMLFWLCTCVDPSKHVWDGAQFPHAKGNHQGKGHAQACPMTSCHEQWKMAEPINLPFGLWTPVSREKDKCNHIRLVLPTPSLYYFPSKSEWELLLFWTEWSWSWNFYRWSRS